ncbi:hypothetical protein HWV01_08625 [Moritella sp. 5]|uniref:hypothetical protein n=1 Tax=Moritella sp. 5 TaxID=2746231 RepID=UPI001BAADA32|nr:hypothetical protein [Moritella sp. 5]QUM80344.1 hypothetical protein HWV01_08625 [Moritella sp. 5]
MDLTLSPGTKQTLLKIKKIGVRQINIFKFHDYVTVVTFVLMNGELVSIRAKDEYVASSFEVFLIATSDELINSKPDVTIGLMDNETVKNIFIVNKCNWSVPTSASDKEELLGHTEGATTQYEGLESDMPKDAVNHAKFEAGIKVQFTNSSSFFVVSSINPFDLAVSHETSFSKVSESEYEFQLLC